MFRQWSIVAGTKGNGDPVSHVSRSIAEQAASVVIVRVQPAMTERVLKLGTDTEWYWCDRSAVPSKHRKTVILIKFSRISHIAEAGSKPCQDRTGRFLGLPAHTRVCVCVCV